ncbi:malto-oligosyltrehalose synthase [Rhizobium sp. SEMIA 4085]|uniref:malto-oligosyltrehalose synthase n=1 Tax=Rhizobium sp. SEMIA 4085 TaxID=2137761 RepID=UPI0014796B23|nr:malto-oligosyltrehalose synthase [Rhizobium sp. SEMIA 4085]NNH28304.1 malto-oligosyltrehalose synthase [Rhizobium sp. SEMIA 4085]
MMLPTSTYRIQFRNGMTFDRAIECVPYFKALGISHLYASPIFAATRGSTHGYDVTDVNEIEPAIGGRQGCYRLSRALKDAGLGLILDIVPNHMAASTENPWWRSVLKLGRESPYARHFDIDWSERLTLPILGKPFKDALSDGELRLKRDPESGELVLGYCDTLLPLNPDSTNLVPASADEPALVDLAIDEELIVNLHQAQHWRLTYWKEAARHLSYRRFFEVTGLVGLRVEDEQVFEDSHRLVLELVRSGQVEGLRLDHIDGLADPKQYLQRLRAETGSKIYIIVEKILGHDETLPASWPIAGTTGYEFISALGHLFVDGGGLQQLGTAYANIAPDMADFTAGLRAAKQLMVERYFEGETTRLVKIVHGLYPDLDRAAIVAAIHESLIAFPVYRIYGSKGPLEARDADVLSRVISSAAEKLADRRAIDVVARLLKGGVREAAAKEFRRRFQQLSGPVMAKAMEDTHFYRYNRLLAVNEVGGDPDIKPGGVEAFHALMLKRAKLNPHGLSATSTHDTKRGEDARARLYTLSEGADVWAQAVERWREMNRDRLIELPGGLTPEPNVEWMLYQALAGIWPEDFLNGEAEALIGRFTAYAEKAIREAKLGTNWNEPHAGYEAAVKAYATALLSSTNLVFHEDFGAVMRPFIETGYLNSLSQTLIKLMAPGIPDIYQGAELLDLSFVDPDNRRPVDMTASFASLSERTPIASLTVPALKQRIVQTGLHLRKRQPELFAKGNYVPLKVSGARKDHVVAFARELNGTYVMTVVPRWMLGWLDPGVLFAGPEFWNDTVIQVPAFLEGRRCDLLTGQALDPRVELPLSTLLGSQPVALIEPVGTTEDHEIIA